MSEGPHPRADQLGSLSTRELLQVMHREDRRAVDGVAAHLDQIAAAVNQLRTPLSFADQLYVLRDHVAKVRRRLQTDDGAGL